jgi:hypothetical protein
VASPKARKDELARGACDGCSTADVLESSWRQVEHIIVGEAMTGGAEIYREQWPHDSSSWD